MGFKCLCGTGQECKLHDKCECGNKKKIVSSTCRDCYGTKKIRYRCTNCKKQRFVENEGDLCESCSKKLYYLENKINYCPKCELEKYSSLFYKDNSYCKSCNSVNARERHRIFKKKTVDYKGGKCQKCGYDKCLGALDFHHKDPSIKSFSLNDWKCTSYSKNREKIEAELDKCDLLCVNCHREEHSLE